MGSQVLQLSSLQMKADIGQMRVLGLLLSSQHGYNLLISTWWMPPLLKNMQPVRFILFFLPESEKGYFTSWRFESRCQKSAVENIFSSGGSDDCQETKYISEC